MPSTRAWRNAGREGRVFLAGDAAHLSPPFAGQGMNSGVRDAHNLAWKIAAVLQGWLGQGALDSYETERRPHAWALILMAVRMGRVFMPPSPTIAWATAHCSASPDCIHAYAIMSRR